MLSSSSETLTSIERIRLFEDDPGFTTSPAGLARTPAGAHAQAAPIAAGPVPFCVGCQLHGHATDDCPKGPPPRMHVRDEHELERLLVGSGWSEVR